MTSDKAKENDDKIKSQKLKALEATLGNLEKQHGKGTIMRLGDTVSEKVEVVSTGSIGLDYALGVGGVPKGRVVEIYGPESSGKTTLAMHIVAEAQKNGGIAAFIDAEHSIGFMRKSLEWILKTYLFRSPTMASKHLK